MKVKELPLIGNRVECLLMLDFEITTDNIVHSRSQANSTNSEFQFTLLRGAWDNQREEVGPSGQSAGKNKYFNQTLPTTVEVCIIKAIIPLHCGRFKKIG